MKYENKENDHVVYFPLVLLCVVVCDCCFTETSKLKVQEIIWGTPQRPPCMPNSEITFKISSLYKLMRFHLHMLIGNFNFRNLTFEYVFECLNGVKNV